MNRTKRELLLSEDIPPRRLRRQKEKTMKKYVLTIVWSTGETERHEFNNHDSAVFSGEGMKMAFGNQIEWMGVHEVWR